jgi:hypothetical protein
VTVFALFLQVAAAFIMFWMTLRDFAEYSDFTMLLGFSVIISLFGLRAKKSFFAREEVGLGMHGTTGIMHPLSTNLLFWSLYLFFEFFGVVCALWIYLKLVWL